MDGGSLNFDTPILKQGDKEEGFGPIEAGNTVEHDDNVDEQNSPLSS